MKRALLIRSAWMVLIVAGCSDDSGNAAEGASSAGAGAGAGTMAAAAGGPSAGTRAGSAAGTGGRAGGAGGAGMGAAGAGAGDDDAGTPGAPTSGTGGASGAAGSVSDGTDPTAVNPYPGYKSDIYSKDELWMCKPGLAKNYCLEEIAEATEALPDGTFKPFTDQLSADHPIDCIFWYPTVNRTEDPTSLDFSDPAPMLGSIRSQAARFSRVCNVYAPFYRQVSLNNGGDRVLAYSDVVESFKHYIANFNKGRDFVVYGHSQGTGHAMRLIGEHIDDVPELRSRLISTLLIGGGLEAGSFSNIPLCTSADQFGCAVGYRAYGEPTPPTGTAVSATLACTNPAALGGGPAISKGAFFVSRGSNYAPNLPAEFTAPWGLFRDFFTAECVAAPTGGKYLKIDYTDTAGDQRDHFLDLSREIGFGLHVFDYNFVLDDLIEMVRKQAAAKAAANP